MRSGVVAALLAVCFGASGCAVIMANLNPFGGPPEELEEHIVQGEGSAKILIVDVSGVISSSESEETLGLRHRESSVARIAEELKKAAKDDDVKALLLRINSPGGSVNASDTIYHEVRSFAERRNVPVVADILDVGASGGYYVALSADDIIASPASVTGSVGVIMFGINVHGLMEKIGVTDQTLTAGAHKDIGSPLREMTPEEHRILQSVLDGMRTRFVGLVRERRPGAAGGSFAAATDGRILTADQALSAGLIDGIGYLDDAIADARRRIGVTRARVILYRRPEEFAGTIYSRLPAMPPQVNLVNFDLGALGHTAPQFMYLWAP